MAPKSKVILTPRARQDLEDIWQYSNNKWGVSKADSYLKDLHSALINISENRHIGKPIDHIREGYRQFVFKEHYIFYLLEKENKIEVVRVIHGSMDYLRHL